MRRCVRVRVPVGNRWDLTLEQSRERLSTERNHRGWSSRGSSSRALTTSRHKEMRGRN